MAAGKTQKRSTASKEAPDVPISLSVSKASDGTTYRITWGALSFLISAAQGDLGARVTAMVCNDKSTSADEEGLTLLSILLPDIEWASKLKPSPLQHMIARGAWATCYALSLTAVLEETKALKKQVKSLQAEMAARKNRKHKADAHHMAAARLAYIGSRKYQTLKNTTAADRLAPLHELAPDAVRKKIPEWRRELGISRRRQ